MVEGVGVIVLCLVVPGAWGYFYHSLVKWDSSMS